MQQSEFSQFFGILEDEAGEIFAQFPMFEDTSINEVKAILSVFCEFGISIIDAKTLGYSMPQILLLTPVHIRNKLAEISRNNDVKGEKLLQLIFRTPNILIDYQTAQTKIYFA